MEECGDLGEREAGGSSKDGEGMRAMDIRRRILIPRAYQEPFCKWKERNSVPQAE